MSQTAGPGLRQSWPANLNYNSCHLLCLRTMVQAAGVCAEGSKAGQRFLLAADLRFRAQNTSPMQRDWRGRGADRRPPRLGGDFYKGGGGGKWKRAFWLGGRRVGGGRDPR